MFFASVPSFSIQALLKGFMTYPNDLGREDHNIWLKFCWFFSQSLPCAASDLAWQDRSNQIIPVTLYVDKFHRWWFARRCTLCEHPSSLMFAGRVSPKQVSGAFFSPVTGVRVVALPKVRHIFHWAGFCEPFEAPHRGCREPPSPSSFLGRGEWEQQAEHARWFLMCLRSFP